MEKDSVLLMESLHRIQMNGIEMLVETMETLNRRGSFLPVNKNEIQDPGIGEGADRHRADIVTNAVVARGVAHQLCEK